MTVIPPFLTLLFIKGGCCGMASPRCCRCYLGLVNSLHRRSCDSWAGCELTPIAVHSAFFWLFALAPIFQRGCWKMSEVSGTAKIAAMLQDPGRKIYCVGLPSARLELAAFWMSHYCDSRAISSLLWTSGTRDEVNAHRPSSCMCVYRALHCLWDSLHITALRNNRFKCVCMCVCVSVCVW